MAIFNRNSLLAALAAGIIGLCGVAGLEAQAVTLPWSSTYDCDAWEQGQTLSCDGMTINDPGSYTDTEGRGSSIESAANNPAGDSNSKALRQWFCGDDRGSGAGVNCQSAGNIVSFADTFSFGEEFWIRVYVRYQQGFTWSSYQGHKYIYFRKASIDIPGEWGGHMQNYPNTAYDSIGDKFSFYSKGSLRRFECVGCGFRTYHGDPADGSWHSYEIYMKRESVSDAYDGLLRVWMNGILVINRSDVRHGAGLGGVTIGSNAKVFPPGDPDRYVDYDDIAITTTTPTNRDADDNPMIGPIGWGRTIQPHQFILIPRPGQPRDSRFPFGTP
jgi:hypothetical protein